MMKVLSIEVPSHNQQILESLHKLQQNGLYCDVSVEAKDGFIYAHHVVLSANGNYFHGHITNSTKTDHQNAMKTLDCKKYDIQLVEVFVAYLYTGKINIEDKYVCDLINLFNEFNLTCASESAKEFINSTYSQTEFDSADQTKTSSPQIEIEQPSLETENEVIHYDNSQKLNFNSQGQSSALREAIFENKNGGEISHLSSNTRNVHTVNEGNNLFLRICDASSQSDVSENKQIDDCHLTHSESDKSESVNSFEKGDNSSKLSNLDTNDTSRKHIKLRIKRERSDSLKIGRKTDPSRTGNEKNCRRNLRKKKPRDANKLTYRISQNITDEKVLKKRKASFNEKTSCILTATESDQFDYALKKKIKTKVNSRSSSKKVTRKKSKEEKNLQNTKHRIRRQKSNSENNRIKPENDNNKIDYNLINSTENIESESEEFSPKKKNKSQSPVWRKCGRCSLSFKSYSEHAAHMREIHKPYPCQLCNWVGHKRHLHASHMYGQHKIVAYPDTYPLVQCNEEGCTFKCLGINLHEHKRCHLHKTDQLVCDVCGMKFTSVGGLRNHSYSHQEEELKYECKECGKIFGWKNLLTNHLFTEHASIKLCHLCPFKTKSKTTLNVHLHNKHGEPIPENQVVHRCDQCEFYCFSSTYLKIHKEQSHSDTANYKCTFCPKSFKSQKSLRMHKVATHDSKNVKCPHCDYATYSKSALSHHLNSSHSDARPFACSYCDYSCKLKCNLGKHIKNVHKLDTQTTKSSKVNQEVNSGSTDFHEKRNEDFNLSFPISCHNVNQVTNMLSLPKSSETGLFMSTLRIGEGSSSHIATEPLSKKSEHGHFMETSRTGVRSNIVASNYATKSTENSFESPNVDSVENILARHMVQEGDKTFMSI